MAASSSRIDFDGRTWSAVAQDAFLEWAGRPTFPDYLRIAFVAWGRHAANGHAVLERGELAHYLVRKDGALPDRRQVWSALRLAISLGFLHETSAALCLVVNSSQVQGGVGDPDRRCHRSHTKHPRQSGEFTQDDKGRITKVGPDARPSHTKVGREAGPSITDIGAHARPFRLRPSLSSPNLTSACGDAS